MTASLADSVSGSTFDGDSEDLFAWVSNVWEEDPSHRAKFVLHGEIFQVLVNFFPGPTEYCLSVQRPIINNGLPPVYQTLLTFSRDHRLSWEEFCEETRGVVQNFFVHTVLSQ